MKKNTEKFIFAGKLPRKPNKYLGDLSKKVDVSVLFTFSFYR